MRTSKFHDSDVINEVINGPRSPSPLRIHKDSHAIHKPSPSPNSHHHHHHLENSGGGATKHHCGISAAKRPAPLIIYTHPPKIIHTQAHDFLTLVQKLTGLERADEENEENVAKSDLSGLERADEGSVSKDDKDSVVMINNNNNYNNNNSNYNYYVGHEENESSSSALTTDERSVVHDSSAVSSTYKMSANNISNSYFLDGPMINPSDFLLCSSSSRAHSIFQNPSMDNRSPISPSLMDYVKGFQDY